MYSTITWSGFTFHIIIMIRYGETITRHGSGPSDNDLNMLCCVYVYHVVSFIVLTNKYNIHIINI